MPNLREMREWNYKEAYTYFMEEKNMSSGEAIAYIQHIAPKCIMKNIRNSSSGIPKEIYQGGWLILMDGESCAGKTTIAYKIKEKFPETIDVVDIDYLCLEWFESIMRTCKSREEQAKLFHSFSKKSDEYLANNLEKILIRKSENGKKSVILVGCFLEIIYRALIGVTLGRHFQNVAFFTVHETWDEIIKHFQSRDEQFDDKDKEIFKKQTIETMKQFDYLEKVLRLQPFSLGFGANKSYVINKHTKLY